MLFYTYNISWQVILDIVYIIDERDKSVYALDNVGKDFWLLIGELHDCEAIKSALLSRYEVDEQVLAKDLSQLAQSMKHMGFVDCAGEVI